MRRVVLGFGLLLALPLSATAQSYSHTVSRSVQTYERYEGDMQAGLDFTYDYRKHRYEGSSKVDDPTHEKLAYAIFDFAERYSVTDAFSLEMGIPLVSRVYSRDESTGHVSDRESRLGDIELLADYSAVHRQSAGSREFWNIIAGVKLPTGDSSALKDEENGPIVPGGAVRPHELAEGTGSADVIFETSYYAREDRFFGYVSGRYTLKTSGEAGYRYGDDLSLIMGPGYILKEVRENIIAVAFNIEVRSDLKDTQHGGSIDGSSSTEIFLGPRLSADLGRHLKLAADAGFAAYKHTSDEQLLSQYEVDASLLVDF